MLEEMEKAGFKATVVSYNAAMSALNKNGQSEQALDLFDRSGADLVLQPGDLLVVRGEHRELDLARDLIAGTLDAEDTVH